MGKPSWTSVLKSSISIRLFAVLFLTVLGLLFVYAAISNHYWDRMTLGLVREEAFRASSFIKHSLVAEMRDKDREHIHRAVRQLGSESGMESIRIYNARGEIRFSSDSMEIGSRADLDSEACRVCHAAGAVVPALPQGDEPSIYTRMEGEGILGILHPILNEGGCEGAGCHPADQRVLGVLDVQLSMVSVDEAIPY